MTIMSLRTWIKRVWLFPLFLLMGIPDGDGGDAGGGDGGGEPGDGNSLLGDTGTPDGSSTLEGDKGGDDSNLSEEEKAAAAEAAEKERREKLTPEEREAEDNAKAEAEKQKEYNADAPEQYGDFTLPDGMEVDSDILGDFTSLAKKQNLSQQKAQELVDLQVKHVGKVIEKQYEIFNADVKARRDAITNDKEIGGDNLKQTKENVERLLGSVLSKDELAELTGPEGYFYKFGDHPVIWKAFNRLAGAIREDSIVISGKGGGASKSAAEVLYGGSQ